MAHLQLIYLFKMVIFYSYVSLPGNSKSSGEEKQHPVMPIKSHGQFFVLII